MNHTKNVLFAVLVLLASAIVAGGIATADADNGVSIDHVQFDMPTKMLTADGSSSAKSVVGYITYADGTVSPYFAFDVKDGKWSGQVNCPDITAGTHTLTVFVSSTAVASVQFTVSDIKIEPSQKEVSVYAGYKADVKCTLTACKNTDVSVSSSNSAVARVSSMSSDGTITVEGVETGSAEIIISCSGVTAKISVTVTTKPAEDKEYTFQIRMDVDADKVKNSKYTQSMLESGFDIKATAKNAADALKKACDANGIPLVQYSNGNLKGWITSMFGLGDVKLDSGDWKYWIQYYEGSYNNYTLGYYTDGGTFQLVYGVTSLAVKIQGAPTGSIEVGSSSALKAMISPDGREPGSGETVTWTSSDPSVVTVSGSGKLAAVGIGTATISVKVDYGGSMPLQDSITVTVVEKGQGTDVKKEEQTSQKTNTDGSEESSKTTTWTDSQGNKVQETATTKENPDGSKVETESNTVTKADGSTATTRTETETDSQGNITGKTETVTETTVVKNKDGTTSETVSEKVTKQDGSVKESESTVTTQKDGTKQEQKTEKSTEKDGSVTETTTSSVTSKDGTVTTEGTSVSKDSSGNASGTTEFTETVKTSSNKTTTTRSETYTDANGNASGSKDIVTEEEKTSSGTETVKTESVKDANGNAVSSTESTTKVQTKAVSGGSNTVTTSSEVSKDADGNTTSTREEVRDVTIGKSSTKVESTVVQKDADGKETLRQELSSESKTAKDGSVTTTVSQKESSEDRTVESSSKTVKGADGSESKESTRTTSTSDETIEEKSESSKTVSEGTTTETKKAQETVKDASGNVKSETEKVDESVESADGKSKYSSEQVKKDGTVELTESSSVESADGSVSSKTDVSVKDGTVQKAESVTSVATAGGSLDADAAKAAVEQSKASIGKTSVNEDEVQKTLKVESSEGTGLTLSPDAMAIISDHGASLKVEGSVGSSKGSVTVDTDVCTSLSKDADGQIGLSMDEGKNDDLTEAQKATVKERYFIVLGATVGDKKVHDLGGKATVAFGYAPKDGQDISRLCIFYVAEDGSRTRMDSTFDPATGMFSMATDHFSVFMVAEDADEGGSGTSTALAAGIVAVLIVGLAAVFLVMRSRKS